MRASSIVLILLVYSIYQISIATAVFAFVVLKALLSIGIAMLDDHYDKVNKKIDDEDA